MFSIIRQRTIQLNNKRFINRPKIGLGTTVSSVSICDQTWPSMAEVAGLQELTRSGPVQTPIHCFDKADFFFLEKLSLLNSSFTAITVLLSGLAQFIKYLRVFLPHGGDSPPDFPNPYPRLYFRPIPIRGG